jgi:hypothetical protein
MRWQQWTSGHSYLRVWRWPESIYTLQGKNLTNTPYAWPTGSHVQHPFAKSLLCRNRAPTPGMKSWLLVMHDPTVILGCLILPPTNHIEARMCSSTKLTGPHKTRYAVSTNQSLPSGPKWPVLNQHRQRLPHRNLGIATVLSPPFHSECSTDPPTCPARSSNSNKHSIYSSCP